MRVLSRPTLTNFWTRHPDAKAQLEAWFSEASKAAWKTPKDIKAKHPSASFVAPNRVVFNIKGNSYRLVISISYAQQIVFVKFVGTHAEYDKIDVATVQLE